MLLGFTTDISDDISLSEKIKVFKKLGCNSIELNTRDADKLDEFLESLKRENLSNFQFVSFHAPAGNFLYTASQQTKKVLDQIQRGFKAYDFAHVIIHPNLVKDWNVFKKYEFPITIENMDNRKDVGRTRESLEEIFNKIDADMVLDLNHCYVNDDTMDLAREMYYCFKDRIKEIHISGFEKSHEPLFKTRQDEIIRAIPNKDIPIIIESSVKSVSDIEEEYYYVKNHIEAMENRI